ncbi:MAG TPA: response regulator [Geothrix sp.]|jgi:CheY-like chemotaxis protein
MGQRLLLVDSDRSFLKEHQVSLEAAFDLEVASSPEGVVARLEHGGYAAVLICVEVSDNKGYALCSTIRKQPALDGVKIALISAKATEEEYRRHQSLKGRADLYLNKPIAPSALVAALAPLVPGRALDPDNPLGELVDTELGDDWLDNLKGAAEAAPAPAPVPARPVAPLFPPPPLAAGPVRNLEARATSPLETSRARLLEEQLAALREELRVKDQRLQEAESELQRQLGSVTLNLEEVTTAGQEAEALKARLAKAEAALAVKDQELAAALEAQAQLNASLEELVGQHSGLEGLHQSALLEVANHKEKAHLLQLELAGLEATMRGQGRDLAELGIRLRQVEAELEASQAQTLEREQQLQARQEALQERQAELDRLTAQIAELRQQLDEKAIQHDGERLELMNGLDQKEAQLSRLSQTLAEQQESYAVLEREKQAAHGQLSEHRDRLQNLDALLQEVQERLRRGSDLARG